MRKLVYTPSFRFPIASLLRVEKYRRKGFNISRNEMIKVCLQISQHNITSLNDVVTELGSIYGINISNLYPKDEDFTVDRLIDILSNLEGDFITDFPQKTITKAKIFRQFKSCIKIQDSYRDTANYHTKIYDEKGINIIEYPVKVYKWVSEDLTSFYKNTFKYRLNSMLYDEHGIYCCLKEDIMKATYNSKSRKVLLELIVMNSKDVYLSGYNTLKVKRCFVNKVVTDFKHKTEKTKERMIGELRI